MRPAATGTTCPATCTINQHRVAGLDPAATPHGCSDRHPHPSDSPAAPSPAACPAATNASPSPAAAIPWPDPPESRSLARTPETRRRGAPPTGRPRRRSACAALSLASVGGVAMPARCSRKLVMDLSTQRSMARGIVDHRHAEPRAAHAASPGAASPARTCRRRCVRTKAASGSASAKPGMAMPVPPRRGRSAQAASDSTPAWRRARRRRDQPPRVPVRRIDEDRDALHDSVRRWPKERASSAASSRARGGSCGRCRAPSPDDPAGLNSMRVDLRRSRPSRPRRSRRRGVP